MRRVEAAGEEEEEKEEEEEEEEAIGFTFEANRRGSRGGGFRGAVKEGCLNTKALGLRVSSSLASLVAAHGLIVSPTSVDRSDRAPMTLRASMLVLLIYDAPNLRRVTYIVSPALVSLYTRCSCLLRERARAEREPRPRPRKSLMACTVCLPTDRTVNLWWHARPRKVSNEFWRTTCDRNRDVRFERRCSFFIFICNLTECFDSLPK